AGAALVHAAATAPLLDGPRVSGASVKSGAGSHAIRARFTILAAGANLTTVGAFGLAAPAKPDAVAGRAYFEARAERGRAIDHLIIAYDRRWCPGYGWIFPGPGGRFNIGVGLFGAAAARGGLQQFFEMFCRTFPPAARLL